LRCPVTQSPIGWKRNDSCSQTPVAAKVRTSDRESRLINEMENALADLAQALRERLAVIRDEQSRRDEAKHIARLRTVSEKIDRLQATLPQPIDPRLAHYLQRKSYDKALEFLEGQITENTARR
jgi:rubrerythrin